MGSLLPTAASSSGSSTGGVIAGIIIIAAIVVVIVLYYRNEKFREAVSPALEAFSDLFSSESKTLIRKITPDELNGLMASIGAMITGKGYVPQSQSPGLYVYQKQEKPSCLIGLILLCMCLIPGILYLFLGGKTRNVSIQVSDMPQGHNFDIKAPGGIKRRVTKMLEPYRSVQS